MNNLFFFKTSINNKSNIQTSSREFKTIYFDGKPSFHQINNHCVLEVSGAQYDSLIKGESICISITDDYEWVIELKNINPIIGLDKMDTYSYCESNQASDCLCTYLCNYNKGNFKCQ